MDDLCSCGIVAYCHLLAAFARDWLVFVIIYYTLQSLVLFHRSLRCFQYEGTVFNLCVPMAEYEKVMGLEPHRSLVVRMKAGRVLVLVPLLVPSLECARRSSSLLPSPSLTFQGSGSPQFLPFCTQTIHDYPYYSLPHSQLPLSRWFHSGGSRSAHSCWLSIHHLPRIPLFDGQSARSTRKPSNRPTALRRIYAWPLAESLFLEQMQVNRDMWCIADPADKRDKRLLVHREPEVVPAIRARL